MEIPMINTSLEQKPYLRREAPPASSERVLADVFKEGNIQGANLEAIQIGNDRAELGAIIDGSQEMSDLHSKPVFVDRVPDIFRDPIVWYRSFLEVAENDLKSMLAEETRPLDRFMLKTFLIGVKILRFEVALLDILFGERGNEEEEDDEERKKLASLKTRKNGLNILKPKMQFSFLSFLNIFNNSSRLSNRKSDRLELATME